MPSSRKRFADALGERRIAREFGVPDRGLGHLRARGEQRIEVRHRILEHVADRLAAQRAQRARRRASRGRCRRTRRCPRLWRPGGGSNPKSERTVTDLPHPDSPTRQTISPRVDVEVDALDGANACRRPGAETRRRGRAPRAAQIVAAMRDDARAHRSCSPRRGSSTSFNPSPSRLKPSVVTRIATPGNTAIHHALVEKRLREEQELAPAYLVRVAQARGSSSSPRSGSRAAICNDALTMTGGSALGRISLKISVAARRAGEPRRGDEILVAQLQELGADDARGATASSGSRSPARSW